jgi:glycosyltransferase involved in cell wall biosynthesis
MVYSDYEEFKTALKMIKSDSRLKERLGNAGYKYVKAHFSWDKVMEKYWNLITIITENS